MMDIKLIIMALIIFAVLSYYNCWFPQYGLCSIPQANSQQGGQGSQGAGCPPLGTKMRANYNAVMTATQTACSNTAGVWTETDTEVSCKNPNVTIDCTTNAAANAAEVCHTLGGVYHCQDNYVGCYCPGSGAVPYGAPSSCAKTIDWNSGNTLWTAACQGPCGTGKTCTESGNACTCSLSQPPL